MLKSQGVLSEVLQNQDTTWQNPVPTIPVLCRPDRTILALLAARTTVHPKDDGWYALHVLKVFWKGKRIGLGLAVMEATTSEKVSELDGSAPESTDFANYFCTYAYLYHQASLTSPAAVWKVQCNLDHCDQHARTAFLAEAF